MHPLLAEINSGESQTIEFKTSFQKEVIASVFAFANAKGGKIFIGVKDSGELVGVELKQESLKIGLTRLNLVRFLP